MSETIGHLFLNLAFGLYLILYLPQIYHNARHQAFQNMSFLMHMMILQAYSCDLFYGLSKHMPWQYLCVSVIGLVCLSTQHLQWFFYRLNKEHRKDVKMLLLGFLSILWPLLLCISFPGEVWQYKFQAWVSRILFLVHFIPQIVQYHQNKLPRDAINLSYLGLSITLSICDLISAVCLHWDNANQWGTFISLGLKTYLVYQIVSKRESLVFEI